MYFLNILLNNLEGGDCMDDFIKKIFDIDKESDSFKKKFEEKKNSLLEERKKSIEEIDQKYHSFIKEQDDIFKLKLEKEEKENSKKLESFVQKSKEMRKIFNEKKDFLIDDIAKRLLESGELGER
ncbi:hypothetical protein HMPREF3188_00634 [Tissierellia bacterium KA00581]|nr:hypothetical protein HMPREF3188_00634 [Tissierellia bacterium KA00581]